MDNCFCLKCVFQLESFLRQYLLLFEQLWMIKHENEEEDKWNLKMLKQQKSFLFSLLT